MRKDAETDRKPAVEHSDRGGAGLTLNLVPPLELDIDAPELRFERLSRITAEYTVPRLISIYEQAPLNSVLTAVPGAADIHQMGRLILGPDPELAAGFFLKLKDQGVSLDDLHSKLLGPTASHLGELWDQDKVDFIDVTLGVMRLQRLVTAFEGLDDIIDGEDKKSILIVGAPGEQHSLGNTIIQRFFRASGWQVWNCITAQMDDVARISADNWFGIIGFSLSLDRHFGALRAATRRIRSESLNRNVGIIVGGSALHRHPDWVKELGADGKAEDGPTAVVLANKLLADAVK